MGQTCPTSGPGTVDLRARALGHKASRRRTKVYGSRAVGSRHLPFPTADLQEDNPRGAACRDCRWSIPRQAREGYQVGCDFRWRDPTGCGLALVSPVFRARLRRVVLLAVFWLGCYYIHPRLPTPAKRLEELMKTDSHLRVPWSLRRKRPILSLHSIHFAI